MAKRKNKTVGHKKGNKISKIVFGNSTNNVKTNKKGRKIS